MSYKMAALLSSILAVSSVPAMAEQVAGKWHYEHIDDTTVAMMYRNTNPAEYYNKKTIDLLITCDKADDSEYKLSSKLTDSRNHYKIGDLVLIKIAVGTDEQIMHAEYAEPHGIRVITTLEQLKLVAKERTLKVTSRLPRGKNYKWQSIPLGPDFSKYVGMMEKECY